MNVTLPKKTVYIITNKLGDVLQFNGTWGKVAFARRYNSRADAEKLTIEMAEECLNAGIPATFQVSPIEVLPHVRSI